MSSILAKKKLLMAQSGGIEISDVFNVSLWTGNGAARTITTGINSGPGSLAWIKSRSSANSHVLIDTVRGATNYISSNTTTGTTTESQSITSFSGSGYSLGTFSGVNGSSVTQVGWQFRRAKKFFDIVQYTGNGVSGRQIAHDLGIKPGMIVVKGLSGTRTWPVYHQSLGATQFLVLNGTDAATSISGYWNNTEPDSASFFVGDQSNTNLSGTSYIAYIFAHDTAADGLIQCGSYTGNGTSSGPVINLGWKPQYLMIKNASVTNDWHVLDTPRGLGASTNLRLYANVSSAETGALNFISLSPTGFSLTSSYLNNITANFVYMAIREAA